MTIRPKIRSGVVLASLSTIVLAGVPLASATPAGSDNVPSLTSTVADNSEVDAATREKADRFISTQEDQFVIDGAAKSVLTPNELQKVEASVKEANTAIASASSTNDPSVEKKVNDKSIAFPSQRVHASKTPMVTRLTHSSNQAATESNTTGGG